MTLIQGLIVAALVVLMTTPVVMVGWALLATVPGVPGVSFVGALGLTILGRVLTSPITVTHYHQDGE